ncbi:MAG: Clp protease N-terminal domain-containing protein [Micromonosporaceae bacterium]
MFERFTEQARQVVVQAQVEARGLRHPWIGTEHLMLAALCQPDAPGVAVFSRLGVTAERYREELALLIGSPDLSDADAEALRTLGINLDEVKRRVEERFGPGALDAPRRHRRSWLPWRWRDCDEPTAHVTFRPRAKKALELALRQAIARKDRHIGVEHLLLGLMVDEQNVALEVLRALGVDPETVRRQLRDELGRAA